MVVPAKWLVTRILLSHDVGRDAPAGGFGQVDGLDESPSHGKVRELLKKALKIYSIIIMQRAR